MGGGGSAPQGRRHQRGPDRRASRPRSPARLSGLLPPGGETPGSAVALLLAYDGTAYRGWQVQRDARTVQGTVRDALRPLLGDRVRVMGASRTDAGVHALGQVASVSGGRAVPPAAMMAALNATLPRDIRVRGVRAVPPGFDARRAARLKRYVYLVATDPVPWPFLRGYTWNPGRRLNPAAMRAAAGALRGRHDFSAFRAAAGRGRPPVCHLSSL
ncbi:MAG TPA: hypothetical protein VLD61_10720, partial [Methylomirabilota bacterium]|nr:hypothetical protein [Methylomirabilota bacterium]